MRFSTASIRLMVLSAIVAVFASANAHAQDVSYKTKTKMNLEALGFLGNLIKSDVEEKVYISGDLKRVDRKDNSTITDLQAQHIVNLDHKKKEYSIVTFDEMMAMLDQAMGHAEGQAEDARAQMDSTMEASEYTVEFDVRVEETGKEKKFGKHMAEQKIVVMEALFEPKDEAARDTLPSTAMFVITDMWQAESIPEMAASDEFNRKMAELLRRELTEQNMSTVISALLKSDPRIGDAMTKAGNEMKKVGGGTTLLSTMYIVTVPPDKELDLPLAIGEKEKEKKGGGFGSMLKQAAKMQGVDVGEDDEEEKEMEQSTLFSVESKTDDIKDKEIKRKEFEIPGNYEEVEFELPTLAGGQE